MLLDGHKGPVVQPGAADMPLIDGEAQGMEEVQRRVRRGAGSCDVAGILRDLRLDQYNVQRRSLLFWNVYAAGGEQRTRPHAARVQKNLGRFFRHGVDRHQDAEHDQHPGRDGDLFELAPKEVGRELQQSPM